MKTFYVPFSNEEPATYCINGHNLIISSPDSDAFDGSVLFDEFDQLREFMAEETADSHSFPLEELARKSRAGLIVAPTGVVVDEIIRTLKESLPWIH